MDKDFEIDLKGKFSIIIEPDGSIHIAAHHGEDRLLVQLGHLECIGVNPQQLAVGINIITNAGKFPDTTVN